jgi:hypothetical protein
VGTAGAEDLSGPSEAELERYAKACNHYVNRTRFVPRDTQPGFFVTLADGCQNAQVALTSKSRPKRAAAAAFLGRMADLRDTIIEINMDRLFGDNWTRFSRPKAKNTARTASLGQVSQTGEYLIAYRMGLIAALNAWQISDRDVSLAGSIEDGGKPTP